MEKLNYFCPRRLSKASARTARAAFYLPPFAPRWRLEMICRTLSKSGSDS